MKKFLLTILILSMPANVQAARVLNEASYQELWCRERNGISEYVLEDKTRVDCLTEDYAVEFDFANKWAESIGQALHYEMMTGKKPAIILIIEKPKDFIYYDRIKSLCDKYGISLWYIKGPFYKTNGKPLI